VSKEKEYKVRNLIVLEFYLPFKLNDQESDNLLQNHLLPAFAEGMGDVFKNRNVPPLVPHLSIVPTPKNGDGQ